MHAIYDVNVRFSFIDEIDELENLKSAQEYAEEFCQNICDEAKKSNVTCLYHIIRANREV